MRSPGWVNLFDGEGNSLYFSENTSLNDAIAKAKAEGHDTEELEARMKVPANWGFSLLSQRTKQ